MNKQKRLIRKIREGDNEAFSLLVKDLTPTAYKTAFLILKSKEHAEDAVQLALEGAYINIMKNKNMTNFKAWFYRIVYSRSIDLYRKNKRYLHTDFEDNIEAQLKLTSQSAQQELMEKEHRNEILNHVMDLKREESLPMFLHYYEELTIKEISLVLDENINTVKSRLKRGKKKLSQTLKKPGTYSKEVKSNEI